MTNDKVKTGTVHSSDRVELIAAHQSKFLSFLSARVEYRAAAEDILRSTYLKAVEHCSDMGLEPEQSQLAQTGQRAH